MLSVGGALYANVITEPLYTGFVRVRSIMAPPKAVNAVAGFGTPSTVTSKLERAGVFTESTLQAQIQEIVPLINVPVVFGNVAALARGVPVAGFGRARRPTARKMDAMA